MQRLSPPRTRLFAASRKSLKNLRKRSAMKSIVMIASSFPPEGNAGSYRPLRFVKNLPSIGWQPTVVTLETDFYERYDPNLLTLVPPETTVIRVRNPDPWKTFQQWRATRIQRKLLGSPVDKVCKIRRAHQAS